MPTRHATGSINMASDEPGDVDVSGFADYERYDALGLAELVRRRRVSPGEILEAAIERVAERNPAINAVTMPLYDYGRAAIAAGLPDGPFTGVPFLMKDLTASIAGVKMTRSSRFFADAPPPAADSEHVTRLKRAGLVIFGRTNTCELGLSLTCEPQLHGRRGIPGIAHASRAARVAARRPRSPRACSRWRTRPTASARSARQRRAVASSGSSPRAGATRWRPRSAKGSADARSSTR